MRRRAAFALAGGVIAALASGLVAVAIGLSTSGSATATEPTGERPIVRTVTVHRKDRAEPAAPVRVVQTQASSPAPSAGEDDEHEDEAHEEGERSEEHEGGDD